MSEHVDPPKKTAGELLKETRESKGVSLRTVHEITKIPMDVLKAIEEGYSVRTMSPFYLKGFIKMYAEYLEIDPAKVLEKPARVLQKAVKPSKPKITQIQEKTYKAFDDDFEFHHLISKERQRQIIKIIGALIVLFIVVKMIGCFIPSKGGEKADVLMTVPVESPEEIAEKKIVKPIESSQEEKVFEAAKEAVAQEKKQDISDGVELTVTALKGGWLQVKVDGNVVTQGSLKAGAKESWKAKKEIIISGRIVNSLEYILNGELIEPSIGQVNTRRAYITKKGIKFK